MPSIPYTVESREIDTTTIERNGVKVKVELRRVIDSEPSLIPFNRTHRKYYKVEYHIKKEGNLLGGIRGSRELDEDQVKQEEPTAEDIVKEIEKEIDKATKTEAEARKDMEDKKPLLQKIGDKLKT